MRCILKTKEEFDAWALEQDADYPVFNDRDEYVFYQEFDPFHSRDQIRVLIEDYVAHLRAQ